MKYITTKYNQKLEEYEHKFIFAYADTQVNKYPWIYLYCPCGAIEEVQTGELGRREVVIKIIEFKKRDGE